MSEYLKAAWNTEISLTSVGAKATIYTTSQFEKGVLI